MTHVATWLAALLLACGCAHGRQARSCDAPDLEIDPRTITSPELAQQITRGMLALRCLRAKAPLRIRFLPASQFLDAREAVHEGARASGEPRATGFYDVAARTIYVLDMPLDSNEMIVEMTERLAHEIAHAVQHQYLDALPAPGTERDRLLAHKAMIEGDASLVALAYAAKAHLLLEEDMDVPLERAVELTARRAALDATKWLELLKKHGDEWSDQASAEELRFIYGDGLKLASTVYFIDGIAAGDKMLARPPISTEQVLYVAKYIAWEEPSPLPPLPAAPGGHAVGRSEARGELGARAVLSPCLGAKRAAESAIGWDGDRATVVTSQGTTRQVWWSTQWDALEYAEGFAAALREAASCVCRELSDGAGEFRAAVRTKGSRVALACGGADTDLVAVATKLL